MQAIVVLCGLFQFRDPRPDILIQSGLVTQDSDTHTVLLRCLQTGLHIIAEQLHQRVHLILRAVPVLCRKSIYCQILDSHTVRLFTDHFHRLGSLHMPVIAGHSFCFGPTAVAVQNNCYMIRNFQILKLNQIAVQPLTIRLSVRIHFFQLFVSDDTSLNRIDQKHFTWTKSFFYYDFLWCNIHNSDLR